MLSIIRILKDVLLIRFVNAAPIDPTIEEYGLGVIIERIFALINENLFVLSSVVLVVVLVIAGIKRMLAADNPKGVAESTMTIVMAIAGYAIIWLAYFIVKFVATTLGYTGDLGYTF